MNFPRLTRFSKIIGYRFIADTVTLFADFPVIRDFRMSPAKSPPELNKLRCIDNWSSHGVAYRLIRLLLRGYECSDDRKCFENLLQRGTDGNLYCVNLLVSRFEQLIDQLSVMIRIKASTLYSELKLYRYIFIP